MYNAMNTISTRHYRQPAGQKRPNIFARVFAAIDRWYDRRNSIRTLEGYSDRLLADIGLYRGQITQFVDGTDETSNRALIPMRTGDVLKNRDTAKVSQPIL